MTVSYLSAVNQKHVIKLPEKLEKIHSLAQGLAASTQRPIFIRYSVVHGFIVTRFIEINNHAVTIGVVSGKSGSTAWIAREIEMLGAVFDTSKTVGG